VVGTRRTEHPGGKRADGAIRQLTEDDVLTVTISSTFAHTQPFAHERVPAIVNGDRLKMMCIM
jgi:hypothetical protein